MRDKKSRLVVDATKAAGSETFAWAACSLRISVAQTGTFVPRALCGYTDSINADPPIRNSYCTGWGDASA